MSSPRRLALVLALATASLVTVAPAARAGSTEDAPSGRALLERAASMVTEAFEAVSTLRVPHGVGRVVGVVTDALERLPHRVRVWVERTVERLEEGADEAAAELVEAARRAFERVRAAWSASQER